MSMTKLSLLALVAVAAGFSSPPSDGNGCYHLTEHKCYCEKTEAECKLSEGFLWTTSCEKPCTTDGDGIGCYNQAGNHKCDCSLSKDECTEGMWTESCSWCVGPIPDGPEGCYDMTEHKCACGTAEADCKFPHVWTTGCASCSDTSIPPGLRAAGLGFGLAIRPKTAIRE